MSSPEIVSTADAAEIVGVSVATINRWASDGRLTPIAQASGTTGARFFLRSDVDAAAAERRDTLLASLPAEPVA